MSWSNGCQSYGYQFATRIAFGEHTECVLQSVYYTQLSENLKVLSWNAVLAQSSPAELLADIELQLPTRSKSTNGAQRECALSVCATRCCWKWDFKLKFKEVTISHYNNLWFKRGGSSVANRWCCWLMSIRCMANENGPKNLGQRCWKWWRSEKVRVVWPLYNISIHW